MNSYTTRPAAFEDIPAIVGLFNAISLDIRGEEDATEEDFRLEFSEPGIELERDTQLVYDSAGVLVAYADCMNTRSPYVQPRAYVGLHPDCDDEALVSELIEWTVRRAKEDLPKTPPEAQFILIGMTEEKYTRIVEGWRSAGFSPRRRFYKMIVSFESRPQGPKVPQGYTLRVMRPDEQRRVHSAMQSAFRDHFGFVQPEDDEKAFALWKHHLIDAPEVDPELLIVAEAPDASIAGGCLCMPVHGPDRDMGWVSSLGVGRSHRRKGLGEALLRYALQAFYDKGKKRAGLGVDAASLTNATGLYRRCGMEETDVFLHLGKVLRQGKDLSNAGS